MGFNWNDIRAGFVCSGVVIICIANGLRKYLRKNTNSPMRPVKSYAVHTEAAVGAIGSIIKKEE